MNKHENEIPVYSSAAQTADELAKEKKDATKDNGNIGKESEKPSSLETPPKKRFFNKRLVAMIVGGFLLFSLGAAAGSGDSAPPVPTEPDYDIGAYRAEIESLHSVVESIQEQYDGLRAEHNILEASLSILEEQKESAIAALLESIQELEAELEEEPEPEPEENELGLEEALVSRVIDGDTIEISTGERVRFIGIDTPERGEPGFEESTAFVRNLIGGQTVWLEADGDDTDRFGRLRRYVWVEMPTDTNCPEQIRSKMLNAMLLERGYAEVAIFGTPKNEALFRDIAIPLVFEQAEQPAQEEAGQIVFWTPNGERWHSTESCRSLARSTDIRSGTVSEAGTRTPCAICN